MEASWRFGYRHGHTDAEFLQRLRQVREQMQAERDRAKRLLDEAQELKRLAASQSYKRQP